MHIRIFTKDHAYIIRRNYMKNCSIKLVTLFRLELLEFIKSKEIEKNIVLKSNTISLELNLKKNGKKIELKLIG